MLALVALCAALAWPDDSPLVPLNAGHPGGDAVYAQVFLAALIAAFALYAVALVLIVRGAVRLKVVAALAVAIQLTPLGGAATALDRRVDVLGLRAHRNRARRQPVPRRARRVPGRSGLPVRRRGLA